MTENGPQPPPTPTPTCPGCRAELPSINWNFAGPIQMPAGPPAMMALALCPVCRAVLAIQLMPVMAPPRPPVIIPGQGLRG